MMWLSRADVCTKNGMSVNEKRNNKNKNNNVSKESK